MKILVLLGGVSNERDVSLRSGGAVSDALKSGGHEVIEYDPQQGMAGLTGFVGKVDCVFPILHGRGGEDGTVQAELEKLGFKYLGSDSRVSRLCYDKGAFKEILNKLSILTPKSEIVTKLSISNSPILRNPYVLKPVDGGSSLDAFIIRDVGNQTYDPRIFDHYQLMLLEELIEGTEITVPILGNTALPVIEIIVPLGKEFDYVNKYNGETQEVCPPQNVDATKQQEVQKLVEMIHIQVGARHLSRTDIIIDREGKPWVLELNTIPGLTEQSLFPKSASAAGLNMQQLVQKFAEMVVTEAAYPQASIV
jgi:D-alanine-D-alanine ligase